MTVYDPQDWLVTAGRVTKDYILAAVGADVDVELNFPDTLKLMPLPRPLIHLEVDDLDHPVLGFGVAGTEVNDDALGTWWLEELTQHHINYDVGVWVSREAGGATKRAQLVQAISDLFAPPGARLRFRDATNMSVVGFTGGRNELDRISDTPVWRALDMTLVTRVVSRYVPATTEVVPTGITQNQGLTIPTHAPSGSDDGTEPIT